MQKRYSPGCGLPATQWSWPFAADGVSFRKDRADLPRLRRAAALRIVEAPARRPVSRVLYRGSRRGDGHPSEAAGRPTARAADPRAGQRASRPGPKPRGCALLFGLAPGGVCPFHSARRLAPPAGIVTVALVLALRRAGVTRHPALRSSDFPHTAEANPAGAQPSDRLADRRIVRAGAYRPARPSGAWSNHH